MWERKESKAKVRRKRRETKGAHELIIFQVHAFAFLACWFRLEDFRSPFGGCLLNLGLLGRFAGRGGFLFVIIGGGDWSGFALARIVGAGSGFAFGGRSGSFGFGGAGGGGLWGRGFEAFLDGLVLSAFWIRGGGDISWVLFGGERG